MNNKQTIPTSYLVIGFVAMSLVIIGILVLFYKVNGSQDKPTGEVNQNSYTDPGSGETVDDPEGKTPETYGVNPDEPIYLGFVKLLNVGLSSDQVEALKAAFLDFAVKQKATEKITEISITTESIHQAVDPNTGSTYSFDLTVNRKTKYHAVVASTGISSIKLTLYPDGKATPIFTASKGES